MSINLGPLQWDACFFFSSRRQHTIWPRDWSSDVCSSDLNSVQAPGMIQLDLSLSMTFLPQSGTSWIEIDRVESFQEPGRSFEAHPPWCPGAERRTLSDSEIGRAWWRGRVWVWGVVAFSQR